jgi:hypothetical protein
MYENCRIYGPYTRKDNRQHIIVVYPNGIKKTVSYPKYLMELKLNRFLDIDETIDHIDGDFTNNKFENLQILNRASHASLDIKRYKYIEPKLVCQVCGNEFILSEKRARHAYKNRFRKSKGPFCSKRCAGIASHSINKYHQYDIIFKITTNKLELNHSNVINETS